MSSPGEQELIPTVAKPSQIHRGREIKVSESNAVIGPHIGPIRRIGPIG
jgi:hypothetical protein